MTRSSYDFKVVGVTFQDEYPQNLREVQRLQKARVTLDSTHPNYGKSLEVEIERTPDNEHDTNAIALSVVGVGMIGHVPRELAAELAPMLDAGEHWRAVVVAVVAKEGVPDKPGIEVHLFRVTPDTAKGTVSPPSPSEMEGDYYQ